MFALDSHTETFELRQTRYRLTHRHAVSQQLARNGALEVLPGHEARLLLEDLWRAEPGAMTEMLRLIDRIPGFIAEPDAWIYDTQQRAQQLLDDLASWTGYTVVLVDRSEAQQMPLVPGDEVWEPAKEAEPEQEPPHYIEFEVLDQDGLSIGALAYELGFPDGRTQQVGRLDDAGYAFLEAIPGGAYKLRFPDGTEEQPEHHKGWLKLALTDDSGAALPGVAYTVTGQGITREGSLDANGRAFIAGIPEGDYQVAFDLHRGAEDEEANADDETIDTTEDWVELVMKQDGKPWPNLKYQLHLPDGTRREGTLDADGRAKEENLPPGPYQVSFPELGNEGWDLA